MSQDENISHAVKQQLIDYFEYLANRIERLTRVLPPEKFWINPFPFGNSIGHIIVHLTGSVRHFIGVRCAGIEYERDRDGEFNDKSGRNVDEVLSQFQEAIDMVIQTLHYPEKIDLGAPVTFGGEPVRNQFGLFLVSAAHMNNHVGQIVYLLHAHGIHLDDQSW
ncbi:DinB family protein [Gimesia aquarii]|uniref:DinB superfamily protein n=1 Tax=Gimesia aquarii TaxID=2527964 RepID=A0A517WTW3_9PLAN|nr:DinB family protein [Gimesia aquarii]QDU08687.1 DinB superfamily protein [Gimesia aquarii]